MPDLTKEYREHLMQLRNALLELHKALLDFQIERYRKKYGRVFSAGKLYEIALNHPSFAWLRQISEIIVSMDEMLDNKQNLDHKQVKDLRQYLSKLLKASATGGKFAKEYYQALQREPAVGLAHSKVLGILKD